MMQIKDMSNVRFGTLTIKRLLRINGKLKWECVCDCGNIVYKEYQSIKNSIRKQIFCTCGCLHRKLDNIERSIVGYDFGYFKVLSFNLKGHTYLCLDNEGKEFVISAKALSLRILNVPKRKQLDKQKDDFAKLNNCLNIKDYTKKSIRLHHIFYMIKRRCYDPTNPNYKYYGGVGIKVCQEWLENTKSFVLWSLHNGYDDNLQIDRIDFKKDYCPQNCRWVSKKLNANNKSNSFFITYNNRTQTLKQWCDELNLDYKYTHFKIRYKNANIEDLFSKSKN